MLAKAFARRWTDIQVLSMHPGWVKTKMGGNSAPAQLSEPATALASWVAGEGSLTKATSGAFVTTSGESRPHPGADNVSKQEELLEICKSVSGVEVPEE
ncbi:hypothetical protein H9Q73_014468 [Fusarium xylarioides]|nr:hypothetical protein H9Q73_014468 [Fusarium xylarioides]